MFPRPHSICCFFNVAMWRTLFLGIAPVLVFGKQQGPQFRKDPTLGADGSLHAHSWNSLYAVNSDGSTKWIFDAGAQLGAHAEGLNGTIYVTTATAGMYCTDPDTLFALDSMDGSIKWKHQVDENAVVDGSSYRHPGGPLAVATDGTTYLVSFVNYTVGGGGGIPPSCNSTTIDAVDADGALKWTFSMAGCGELSAMGADGTLFAMNQKSISALRPDTGTVKWSVALNECSKVAQFPYLKAAMTVSFSRDGNVFLMQHEQNCSRLALSRLSNDDGRFLWKVTLSEWPYEHEWNKHFERFMNLGSNNEVYVNGMTSNGTCSLRVFDFDGIPLRDLPCLRGDTYYGDEEDVFVTVYNPHNGYDVSYLWAHSGSDGLLLWNTTYRNSVTATGHEMRFGQDGTVFVWSLFVGGGKPHTDAIRSGDVVWSVVADEGSHLLMSEDGTTYVQGLTDSAIEIVAVSVDGVEKWRWRPIEAIAEFV